MVKQNVDITSLSNFHTPAKARYFYKFDWDINQLVKVLKKFQNLPKLFVSWGTNLLFAFDIFDGLVIKLADYPVNTNYNFENYPSYFNKEIKAKFSLQDNVLEVSWFENISDVAEILFKENLSDKRKRFIGLPGTIAGAVVGNAGCFGLEIQHTFLKAEVLNLETFQVEEIPLEKASFTYRNSIFKNWKYIVLKAYFDLSSTKEKYPFKWDIQDIITFRTQKQPSGYSCGSFFKNPSRENPAWKLIEEVWLKWYKIWWAFFSEKHANFLMSDGTAKWQDLINLKNLAQDLVKHNFWIQLEPEVNIIN